MADAGGQDLSVPLLAGPQGQLRLQPRTAGVLNTFWPRHKASKRHPHELPRHQPPGPAAPWRGMALAGGSQRWMWTWVRRFSSAWRLLRATSPHSPPPKSLRPRKPLSAPSPSWRSTDRCTWISRPLTGGIPSARFTSPVSELSKARCCYTGADPQCKGLSWTLFAYDARRSVSVSHTFLSQDGVTPVPALRPVQQSKEYF